MNNYYYENIRMVDELHANFEQLQTFETYIPGHWHESIEILYMTSGSLEAVVDHHTFVVHENEILLVNPREIHSTRSLSKGGYILLQIPYQTLQTYIPKIDSIRFKINYRSSDQAYREALLQINNIILEMIQLDNQKPLGSHLKFTSLLFELLYQLYQNFQVPIDTEILAQNNKNLMRLTPILNYTHEHYTEKIHLGDIASYAGFNPEYFCRFFKKNMGITFVEYVNQYRFNRICADLAETDESLLHILEEHGFTNYKLFREMFYQTYSSTPGKKRKELTAGAKKELTLKLSEQAFRKMK